MITGLERIARDGLCLPGAGRVAVLCNSATVDSRWVPTLDVLREIPGVRITRIFSPQHGFSGEKQDNMIASADGPHPRHGIPVVSLYGPRREPEPEHFNGIDALIIDVQDVGTRVYTFLNTALLAIRAAAQAGIPSIVLDRPNPIGGVIEGPVLADEFRSFVGLLDVPLRHGLTPAEFCRYGAARWGIAGGVEALRVVPLADWSRERYYDETGFPWTMPSPNMPTLDTAIVYPGQVALEGTNLSEGRGTTRPFELCGAPWLDPPAVAREWGSPDAARACAGVLLREVAFEPTFQKFAGRLTRGFQLQVIDRRRYRPVAATIALLDAVRRVHPVDFAWRDPPYEYEHERRPIDLIFGTDRVRLAIDGGARGGALDATWTRELRAYQERIAPFLLYMPPPAMQA